MNSIIYIVILLLLMLIIYITKKYIPPQGLETLYIIMSLTSFILAFKYISIFTININSNSITYVTMLTALYLLLETNKKKDVKRIINLNIIVTVFSSLILWIMTHYEVSLLDSIGINMKNVFGNNYRVLIAYPYSVILSSYIMIYMHEKIKPLYDNTFITLVTSYLLIGIIEGIMFYTIGFYKILNNKDIIELVLSTYMIRLIITVIYSIYLTVLSKKKVIK